MESVLAPGLLPFAEVAVNSPGGRAKTFSYGVPASMPLAPGQVVWVPFGRQRVQGVVMEVGGVPAVEEVREVLEVLDPQPVLTQEQMALARWISDYYRCPLFDAAALMLPPGMERRTIIYLSLPSDMDEVKMSQLTPKQRQVLAWVQRRQGRVSLDEVRRKLGREAAEAIVPQLCRHRLLVRASELQRERVRPKMAASLSLSLSPEAVRQRMEQGRAKLRRGKEMALLELLLAEGKPVDVKRVREATGVSLPTLRRLVAEGVLGMATTPVSRDPLAHRSFSLVEAPTLTAAQARVWREAEAALSESPVSPRPRVFLLHGVTGSGKTEIYLRALAEVVRQGKRGIVLVPEIALTPQTIDRFWGRFPHRVAVLHSGLSLGEAYDEWHRIRRGECDVVIGSRGAIFAPQVDLGLIVIDEEHEWTYKQQDQAPRYHARDVALKLMELTSAIVILGSATPDVVSYHYAEQGRYRLLELPNRVAPVQVPTAKAIKAVVVNEDSRLPTVQVVDLRRELRQGNRSIFSRALQRAVAEAMTAGEQAILFLNRRGTATFVQCRNCGFVMRCRRCDVPLTYHGEDEDLVCHWCNQRMPVSDICPNCFSHRIKYLGVGTQKVEEELKRLFPTVRTLRWDRDVTRGRYAHERILDRFLAHQADVLVGTQMIAKGLDLPLVTVVGIVNADVSLYLPDFRAAERTFQVLTQVAGRAGRRLLEGRVVLQTYAPEHYAIVAASHHDYAAFYQREMEMRREYGYPPLVRLVRLLYSDTNEKRCEREGERLRRSLEEVMMAQGFGDVEIVGPTPAYFRRVRGRYRWQTVLKGRDAPKLLEAVPLSLGWTVDVDPVTLL